MKLIVKKENHAFDFEGQKQMAQYSFCIEANGIKSPKDIQEIIRQCRLVENQLTGESNHFSVSDNGTVNSLSDNT
jgi:hypothetical protein